MKLQDRLEAELRVADAGVAAAAPAARVGRHRDGGDAEAHLAEVLVEIRRRTRVAHPRRLHVVEEAAPLVVDDEERAAAVAPRRHEGAHDVGHPRLAEPDVAVRVLVGRDPVAPAAVAERRVDERDVRQRPQRAVRVVLAPAAASTTRRARPRPPRTAGRSCSTGRSTPRASARSKIVSHWLPAVSSGGALSLRPPDCADHL